MPLNFLISFSSLKPFPSLWGFPRRAPGGEPSSWKFLKRTLDTASREIHQTPSLFCLSTFSHLIASNSSPMGSFPPQPYSQCCPASEGSRICGCKGGFESSPFYWSFCYKPDKWTSSAQHHFRQWVVLFCELQDSWDQISTFHKETGGPSSYQSWSIILDRESRGNHQTAFPVCPSTFYQALPVWSFSMGPPPTRPSSQHPLWIRFPLCECHISNHLLLFPPHILCPKAMECKVGLSWLVLPCGLARVSSSNQFVKSVFHKTRRRIPGFCLHLCPRRVATYYQIPGVHPSQNFPAW